MPDVQTAERPSRATWFRGHVMTRWFAVLWWLVMAAFTASFAVTLVQLALEPSGLAVLRVAIVGVICIPILKEWPNASRMGRMLRHGT